MTFPKYIEYVAIKYRTQAAFKMRKTFQKCEPWIF